MHRAVITALGETGRTCVIRFVDYDNYEEVLLSDVQPCAPHKWDNFRPGGPPRNQRRPDYHQQQQQGQGQGEGQRHPYGRTGGYQQGGRNEGRRGDPDHHYRGGQGRPEPGPPSGGGSGGGRAFDEGGNLNQHFSGTFEFRRGGNKPYVQSNRGGGHQAGDQQGGRGGQHSRPPPQGARPDRQYYQPPRQRKE